MEMNELTKPANIAEIPGVLIVIGGSDFALQQIRRQRKDRIPSHLKHQNGS